MQEKERDLVQQSQAGDKEAFGMLVKRYAGQAVGAATLFLGSHDEGLDASQEAFIRAWRSIRRFNGTSKFYTWYSRILRNVCIDRLRKRQRNRETGELGDYHPHEHPDVDPVLLAEKSDRKQRVWQAILELSDLHREVIVLYHFQQMSYQDMAETLDVPFGTITSRLHSARKALREKLAEELV